MIRTIRQAGRHKSRQGGFTLIEALVVVALLGIVLAITAAMLRSVKEKTGLEATVTNLRGLMDRAPTEAVKRRTTVRVRYDPSNRRFQLVSRDSSGNVTIIDSYTLPDGVVFENTSPTAWPTVGSFYGLDCDTMGRLLNPASGARLLTPQSFQVTLKAMQDGIVKPKIAYLFQVFPVWSCRVTKIRD